MTLLLLYFSFHQLGHPDCGTRDRAERRADCLLGSLLAPAGDGPEAGRRADRIRDRWYRRRPVWLRAWADPDGVMLECQGCQKTKAAFLAAYPAPGDATGHLNPPLAGTDSPRMRAHLAWHHPGVRGGLAAIGGGGLCLTR